MPFKTGRYIPYKLYCRTVHGFLNASPLVATIFGMNCLLEGGKEQTARRQDGVCSKFKTRRCLAYTYPGLGCSAHAMTFAIQIVHFYYHFNSRALGRAARVLPPRRWCTEGHHTHSPEPQEHSARYRRSPTIATHIRLHGPLLFITTAKLLDQWRVILPTYNIDEPPHLTVLFYIFTFSPYKKREN